MSIWLINWNISRGFSVYGNDFKDLLTFGDSESSLLSVSRFSDGGFEIFTLSTGGSLVGFSGTDCFDDLLSFQDFKFLATTVRVRSKVQKFREKRVIVPEMYPTVVDQVEMKPEIKTKIQSIEKFSSLFLIQYWLLLDVFSHHHSNTGMP